MGQKYTTNRLNRHSYTKLPLSQYQDRLNGKRGLCISGGGATERLGRLPLPRCLDGCACLQRSASSGISSAHSFLLVFPFAPSVQRRIIAQEKPPHRSSFVPDLVGVYCVGCDASTKLAHTFDSARMSPSLENVATADLLEELKRRYQCLQRPEGRCVQCVSSSSAEGAASDVVAEMAAWTPFLSRHLHCPSFCLALPICLPC